MCNTHWLMEDFAGGIIDAGCVRHGSQELVQGHVAHCLLQVFLVCQVMCILKHMPWDSTPPAHSHNKVGQS